MNAIRPQDVVAEYTGATTIEERRQAYQLYQQTKTAMLCRMAQEMGYAGFRVGQNSAYREHWHNFIQRT